MSNPPLWPRSPRPYTRWWWFNQKLSEQAIRDQLAWVASQGFGGVEIAWIYRPSGVVDLGPEWLSPQWTEFATLAKREADALGLGCDFTYGSLWPFCGSFLSEEAGETLQRFSGPVNIPVKDTWEFLPVPMLNHLTEKALRSYAARMGPPFAPALEGSTSALFCDSWEVPPRGLWSSELWDPFQKEMGYDLRSFIEDGEFETPEVRYDYLRFLASTITKNFYQTFTQISHEQGAISRVQCHGSPTDLLEAYGSVDVPESEALLFPTTFSRIPASAGVLARKSVISCETFTCLYGFPDTYMEWESIADLKLLADAVMAEGVNQIIWHGLAYFDPRNPASTHRFFASTYLGPDCNFVDELSEFNAYLAEVCEVLQRGWTFTQLAVYLPLEDNRMMGNLPLSRRTPAAHSFWELRDVTPPEILSGYHPIWVRGSYLREAEVRDQRMHIGNATFDALYVDVEWLDADALRAIVSLATQGLPIVLKRTPRQPGLVRSGDYAFLLKSLKRLPHVCSDVSRLPLKPFLEGPKLPPYWARRDGDTTYLFLAHPHASTIRYPMKLGQARQAGKVSSTLEVRQDDYSHRFKVEFEPGESLLFEISRAGVRRMDVRRYRPRDLQIREV